MDETDNLVSADNSKPYYTTSETSMPAIERLEDVFQDEIIIAFTSISRFKMFARSSKGLCLDEHVIKDIIDKGDVVEQKLELLDMWRENNGEQATVSNIRNLVASYEKGAGPEGSQSKHEWGTAKMTNAPARTVRTFIDTPLRRRNIAPATVIDNSVLNIAEVENEGIDGSTTHHIKGASNFQPLNIGKGSKSGTSDIFKKDKIKKRITAGENLGAAVCGQSEDSGFQKRNERAESWKRKFFILLIALTVILALICNAMHDLSKKKQEMEIRNDELNEQIQNLAQKKDSETRKLEEKIDELKVQLHNITKEKDSETRKLKEKIDELKVQLHNIKKEKDSGTREMKLQIDKLTEQIQNLKQERDSVAPEFIPCIIYEKNCFWKEVHACMDTTVTEASKICTDKNSRLADIYSEEHYNMIMNYIRTDRNVYVWTGMRKQYQNPDAILSDGRTAPFTKPRSLASEWHTAVSTKTHVYLLVQQDTSRTDQGMGADGTNINSQGALCQSL